MATAVGAVIAWIGANAALAAAIAMAVASMVMVMTMKVPSVDGVRGQAERKQVLRSSTAPEDWVYGVTVKSGLLSFAEEEAGGWLDEDTDMENNQGFVEWLHMVITIAAHPIDRLGRIWFNDDEIGTYGDYASYELLNNPQTANAFLLANCPSWKNDMIGKGCSHLRVSMKFNQQKFSSGIPNIKCEVWGRQVFDPRDNQTKWSDNAALVVLDYVRSHPKIRIPDERIDWESFKTAANVCDEIVTRPDGEIEKRYTINGAFDINERPTRTLEDMLTAMSGELTWFGGMIGVMPGAYYGPAAQVIESSDIISNIEITPETSQKDRINSVSGTFIDPLQNYIETDYPAVTVAEWVEEDGEEKADDLKLRFVTSYYQAQRLANIRLRRNRIGRTLMFTTNMRGYSILPGSYVRLKVPEIEIDKEFRVMSWEHSPNDAQVKLTVREDGIEVWDDAIGKPIDRPPLVNLPVNGPATPSDLRFQVETIGEVVQGVLTWRNSAMTAYTNIAIKRGADVVYVAQEPRNIHRLQGLAAGDYAAELRAVGMDGGISEKATIAFTVSTPAAVIAVDIRAGNWDITLTPRIATVSTYGTEFEFFYYRTPLAISAVESTAQRLGAGAQMTHSGLQTGTVHYYWVRAINAYGKGPLFALQASTTRDVDSVLDVIAGEIGADALKDELKQEIAKIQTLVTPGQLSAAVKTETDNRISQDSALSSRIDTVTATANTAAAGVQSEATARANADSALGQLIDTVTATTGSNTAAIQSEATARANADTAIGKRIDTVQATVGSNTASIQTTATAGTTNDGKTMNAMWSTKASINDVVGGFGLMAEKDPDGATRIKFLVDADIFAVLGRNGDKRAPFVIKNGVVYMNKLLLDDAEIGSVIAKYINVQHLVGTLIEGSSFRSGDLWIGENPNGQFGAYGKMWNAGIASDGQIYGSSVYLSGGTFTGTVNANNGTMNNITIAENCNVLGTIYANRIVGDVAAIRSTLAQNTTISIPTFSKARTALISIPQVRFRTLPVLGVPGYEGVDVSIYINGAFYKKLQGVAYSHRPQSSLPGDYVFSASIGLTVQVPAGSPISTSFTLSYDTVSTELEIVGPLTLTTFIN